MQPISYQIPRPNENMSAKHVTNQQEKTEEKWETWTLEKAQSWAQVQSDERVTLAQKQAIDHLYTQDLLDRCVENEVDENEKLFFQTVLENFAHIQTDDQRKIQTFAQERLANIHKINQRQQEKNAEFEKRFGEFKRILRQIQTHFTEQDEFEKDFLDIIIKNMDIKNMTIEAMQSAIDTNTQTTETECTSTKHALKAKNYILKTTLADLSQKTQQAFSEYENAKNEFLFKKLQEFPSILSPFICKTLFLKNENDSSEGQKQKLRKITKQYQTKIEKSQNIQQAFAITKETIETNEQLKALGENWIKNLEPQLQETINACLVNLNSVRANFQMLHCIKRGAGEIANKLCIPEIRNATDRATIQNKEEELQTAKETCGLLKMVCDPKLGTIIKNNFEDKLKAELEILQKDIEIQLLQALHTESNIKQSETSNISKKLKEKIEIMIDHSATSRRKS